MAQLPFLTSLDPDVTGEGALDPLGLASIGDRLADQILPGLRARMLRPRFLTAIAVSAVICDELEEQLAKDNVTPAYLVFEWLLVEGFVRAGNKDMTTGTPGTLKARAAKDSGEPLCARTYLRSPTIFGFHGVYKPLARNLGIIDDDMRLGDAGYALVKQWQAEQQLDGFLDGSVNPGDGASVRRAFRSAVEDGLSVGYSKRSGAWQGWELFARHLAPSKIGTAEAALIYRLLLDARGGTRGEVFRTLQNSPLEDEPESQVVKTLLLPRSSSDLAARLRAIADFEAFATVLEYAFDVIRYLSSMAGARAITADDFAQAATVSDICTALQAALHQAEKSLTASPLPIQQEFSHLANVFAAVKTPGDLFSAILDRHHEVQQAKKPDGKRDWFESGVSGTFVRTLYRLTKPVQTREWWNRPYRIDTVKSFLQDLRTVTHGTAQ